MPFSRQYPRNDVPRLYGDMSDSAESALSSSGLDDFASFLKFSRKTRCLSIDTVCSETGIEKGVMRKLEAGKLFPTEDEIRSIRRLYKVGYKELRLPRRIY